MTAILRRIRREPVISRAGLAAVLNLLVVSGVLDADGSTALEAAVLGVVNAAALLSARAHVTPIARQTLTYRVRRRP